jgi:hypothetical protein
MIWSSPSYRFSDPRMHLWYGLSPHSSLPSVRHRWMASHALSVSCVHSASQPSPFGPYSTSSTKAIKKLLSAPGVSISRDA